MHGKNSVDTVISSTIKQKLLQEMRPEDKVMNHAYYPVWYIQLHNLKQNLSIQPSRPTKTTYPSISNNLDQTISRSDIPNNHVEP